MTNPLDLLLPTAQRPTTGRYGTPTRLLDNLEMTESGGNNPKAINSQSGATGSYQFLPSTVKMLQAKGIQFDPTDPSQSRDAADQYIQSLVSSNGGSYPKAMAAYGGFIKQDPIAYQKKVLNGVSLPAAPNPLDTMLPASPKTEPVATPASLIKSQSTTAPTDYTGMAGTFLKNIGKAVTLGTSDYVAAGVNAIINGGSYSEALQTIRDINKASDAAHPAAALAGSVTGDIIASTFTGGTTAEATAALGVSQGLGTVGKVALNIGGQAATGAATGAVTGATTPGSTAATILQAAGVGGVGGAAGGVLSEGISEATRRFVNNRVAAINAPIEEKVAQFNADIPRMNKERVAANAADVAKANETNANIVKQYYATAPESGPMPPQPTNWAQPIKRDMLENVPASEINYVTPESYRTSMQLANVEPASGWSKQPFSSPSQLETLAGGVVTDTKGLLNTKLPTTYGGLLPLAGAGALGTGAYELSGEDNPNDILPWSRTLLTGAGVLTGLKAPALVKVAGGALIRTNLMNPKLVENTAQGVVGGLGLEGANYATPSSIDTSAPPVKSLLGQTIDQDVADEQLRKSGAPNLLLNTAPTIAPQVPDVNPLDDLLSTPPSTTVGGGIRG